MDMPPLTASPRLRLPDQDLAALLAERDPDPKPADHLDKHEGEEDAVLEAVTAPAGGPVAGRRMGVGGWVCQVRRRRGGAVERRRGGEEEGVEEEEEGDEEAEGTCRRRTQGALAGLFCFLGFGTGGLGRNRWEGWRIVRCTRTLGCPVMYEPDFLWQAKCDEVRDAQYGKHDAQESEGRGLGLEAASIRLRDTVSGPCPGSLRQGWPSSPRAGDHTMPMASPMT